MASTPRIPKSPGNQIPEQRESQARDCGVGQQTQALHTPPHVAAATAIDDVAPLVHTRGLALNAAAGSPVCRAPHTGRGALARGVRASATGAESLDSDAGDLSAVPETDRSLIEAINFFESPEAQPQLPSEQMIYTSVEDVYTFRPFPNLPVIPPSGAHGWEAVQLNLTHDGSLGTALAVLAADATAAAGVIRRSDKPGHYVVTLKLPSVSGGVLDITNVIDARVPATEQGRILGSAGSDGVVALWPLIVAKAIGKLVRVLRTSGHLPPRASGPALTYTQFSTWLTGRAPQVVTDLHEALMQLSTSSASAMALQVPTPAPSSTSLPGGRMTSALGGMAHRLRSHSGNLDVLLLNGHHYGVVGAESIKNVTLYNPLGFNPHSSLADAPDGRFFDPHSLSHGSRTRATMVLPSAWLKALHGTWFL